MRRTVLFVPGFVADTYSEIEQSFVELSAYPDSTVQFLWLVPNISAKGNSFTDQENRKRLDEPIYVPHLRRHGISYVVGDVSKYNAFSNLFLFRRLFREHSIDAVYTHFGHERFWATMLAKLCGKVTIWNEHWHSLGTRFVFPKRLFYRLFVDHVISISEFITSTLPQAIKVHTIPNAINAVVGSELSGSQGKNVRKEFGIEPGQKIVLMVAAFRNEKRHELALEVAQRVLTARDDVIFVFLGEGPLRQAFLDKVRSSDIRHRVHAPGHVQNVNDFYATADVCMLTSYFEPFGYCVLEAMQFGVPVVAFNNGGPAEIIRDGNTGLLVNERDTAEFASKILELLKDDNMRQRIGENAIEAVERDYSREIWMRKIVTVLRESVDSARIQLKQKNGLT
jgi:glycosyltransferase involved in cell wall biosynthesis